MATPGLSCGTLDLPSSLQHMSSLVATCKLFNCSMWDLVPWPGVESRSPALGVQSLSHWTIREDPHWTFEEGWVSRPDSDSDSTHWWVVFYVYVNCLVVVCGAFHCVSPVLPHPLFFLSLNHFKALSYKNPSGIAMEKPPAWVAWLHYPGSWVDLDQQSSWKICICFYSDALLLTNTKAIFSWRLPDCSIYFLLENVFSFVAISDTEKLSVSLFSLRETTP